jgi:putative PepSY-like beta-lactamase-inhibitor
VPEITMKRLPAIATALASMVLGTGAWAHASQASARTAQVQTGASLEFGWPDAVKHAFKQKYPKATVKAVITEAVAGKTVYEVESIDNGRRRNIDYNPDGTIIRYEEELTEAEVPAVVLAAIKTRYPKAAITLRERLYTIKDNTANYECQLTGAGVSEVILTPDGKWVSPKAGR